ncbi:hypothetical protein J6I75_06430 [Pseudidiomarina sp. 1APP75-27a]|uniref:hypothetical protein n=1 Tax=Pseudidiomarina terrestris TaxID=2820060 RepID=UPI0026521B8D|nr:MULTISPECIES: hypothetical protein [unclassified Pseudidiomarina]MDN7126091.1 hypothetical protein [Pseudidiomarina sp. 1APR75-33.1]MDN7138235.1 hypothetical protein [Pseudidiomarina sp. 1ASP75-14]MEA3587982.1 hypothetical protein [Pseudidiomarina sp. 1APP75-27a]
MKNPLSPFWTLVVSVTLFLFASQLLLKYADSARFWLQQKLAPVTAESHTIFQEALGNHYIVAPYMEQYYYLSPYYYTPFDAAYNWHKMTSATEYQACAIRSQLCIPGVVFHPSKSAAEMFEIYADMMRQGKILGKAYYCVGGVLAIGNDTIDEQELKDRKVKILSFSTSSGTYIVDGLPEDQLKQWRGRCS